MRKRSFSRWKERHIYAKSNIVVLCSFFVLVLCVCAVMKRGTKSTFLRKGRLHYCSPLFFTPTLSLSHSLPPSFSVLTLVSFLVFFLVILLLHYYYNPHPFLHVFHNPPIPTTLGQQFSPFSRIVSLSLFFFCCSVRKVLREGERESENWVRGQTILCYVILLLRALFSLRSQPKRTKTTKHEQRNNV